MSAPATNAVDIGRDLLHPERWREDVTNPDTQVGALALGLVFLFFAWLAGRAVSLAIHRYLDRAEREGVDPTGIRFLGKLANLAVYIFAFIIYSHLVPALQHLGAAWLTSVGLVSVVVGLAAQSTLGNLISGVSLVLYRPFRVGDLLQISTPKGLETGTVESINLGTTVLRTADNRRIVVPNNTMATTTCINLTAARKGAPCTIVLMLAAETDANAARKILTDVVKANPLASALDGIQVTSVSSWTTELTINAWCADPDAVAQLKSDLLLAARKEFDAAGIKLV